MNRPPSREELARFVLGEGDSLPADIRAQCEAPDERLAARLAALRDLVERAADAQIAPSTAAVARAEALVPDAGDVQQLVAELIEDTSLLEGVRDESADGRFLVFRAGDWDLHLRLQSTGDPQRVEVRGQLLGPDESDVEATVVIEPSTGATVRARTSASGEFSLTCPPPPFRVAIDGGPGRIQTPLVTAR